MKSENLAETNEQPNFNIKEILENYIKDNENPKLSDFYFIFREKFGDIEIADGISFFHPLVFLNYMQDIKIWHFMEINKDFIKILIANFLYSIEVNSIISCTREWGSLDFARCVTIKNKTYNEKDENILKLITNGSFFEKMHYDALRYIRKDEYLIDKNIPFDSKYFNTAIDIFIPDCNVILQIHNVLDYAKKDPYDWNKVSDYELTNMCDKEGIRIIHIYEPFLYDLNKTDILLNAIKHACGKTERKVYARDCEIKVYPALEFKQFYIENNIQGYRNARSVFVLHHKKTKEPLMMYSVGFAHFGKGAYDAEIARGACKLNTMVIGGASKLWKFIQDYYKDKNLDGTEGSVNSICYYVDRNFYNGQSMNFLDGQEYLGTTPGFWNYWIETKELKNREPHRHSYIMQCLKEGKIIEIKNAGTQTNVWIREGFKNEKIEQIKNNFKKLSKKSRNK